MARLKLHVSPRGSKEEVLGIRGDALAIKLTAPPVDGAANRACIIFLSKTLKIRRSQIRLVSGEKSRDKTFEIDGITEEELQKKIALLLSD